DISPIPLDYLKSIGAFPITQLMELDEKQFTGQFISSTILTTKSIQSNNSQVRFIKTNDEIRRSVRALPPQSNCGIDLKAFATDAELRKWFELLLALACDGDEKSNESTICEEASKALVYIIDQKTSSFAEKLSFIDKYIFENKHPALIEQFFIELNEKVTLLSWIEVMCDDDDSKPDKATSYKIS
ncbi:unnamed protein product, partial [Didymodactylos carnosus]